MTPPDNFLPSFHSLPPIRLKSEHKTDTTDLQNKDKLSEIFQKKMPLISEKTGEILIENQQRATHALHKLFCSSLPINEKQYQINLLKKDLAAKEPSALWIAKLFKNLPRSTWHLIFFHFNSEIFKSCSFVKASCDCCSDLFLDKMDEWVSIASQAVQNILQCTLNEEPHYLTVLSLRQIFTILTHTQTDDKVLAKFSQNPEMIRFIHNHAYENTISLQLNLEEKKWIEEKLTKLFVRCFGHIKLSASL
jgi:hypothetical protein